MFWGDISSLGCICLVLQCLVGAMSPPKMGQFTLLAFPTSTPIPRTARGSLQCLWAMESISTSLCCKQSPTTISSPFGEYSKGVRTEQSCCSGCVSARCSCKDRVLPLLQGVGSAVFKSRRKHPLRTVGFWTEF